MSDTHGLTPSDEWHRRRSIDGDRVSSLKAKFPWSMFTRNLHGSDYSMFWANIRQNAMDRTHAFIDAQNAMDASDRNLTTAAVGVEIGD
jgi:hypothetical protein